MATPSDQQLIQYIQQGRREAVTQLFDRYSADLYDFLARLAGDRDQAARLLEEVFMRVPGAVAGLPTRESVRGWLYSLAREAGLNWLRQKGWLDTLPPSDEPIPPGPGGDIWKAARSMPAFHRAVLIIEELHGLSPTEKARALGVQRTDLSRLVEEARKSFTRAFDAQARAEGRPTSAQMDLERIGLRRRVTASDATLFSFLPILLMPDSLQQALRQRITQAVRGQPLRPIEPQPAVTFPPQAEAGAPPVPPIGGAEPPPPPPLGQPVPEMPPGPEPEKVTVVTETTRSSRGLLPFGLEGASLPLGALAALAGVALALIVIALVYLFAIRDTTKPVIDGLDPADGASVPQTDQTTVVVSFHDDKGVDPTRCCQITIDRADETAGATITSNGMAWSGPLGLGGHFATASISDRSGNKRDVAWHFTIVPPSGTSVATPTAAGTVGVPTVTRLASPTELPTLTPLPTITPTATLTPTPSPTSTSVPLSPTPCIVSVSGTAFDDLNGNQIHDNGEPTLSGVVITLQNYSGAAISGAITNSFGTYQFLGLPLGTYRVQAATPPGWFATTPTIFAVNLLDCGAGVGVDFGFNQATPTPVPSNTPTVTPIIIIITNTPTNTPTPIPPTSTPTPITPTNTPTPVTPTSTPTPITPTSTPTSSATPAATQVQTQTTIAALSTGSATATCPGGTTAMGGGFSHNGLLEVDVSTLKLPGNGWTVSARNTSGGSVTLTVNALCVSNVPGIIGGFPQLFPPLIPSGGTGQVAVSCPSNQILTGGGFSTSPNMEVYVDSPQGQNSWMAAAKNNSGSQQALTVIAVCYSGTGTSSTQASPVSISNGTTGTANVTCPSGRLVTGGGYVADIGLLVYDSSQFSNGWQASANNTTASPKVLTVYAVCTTF